MPLDPEEMPGRLTAAAAEALVAEAGEMLGSGGVLFLYGPYRRFGRHTAPSNEAFDASLRASDPAWGVRDLEAVAELGRAAGLDLEEVVEMPANNLSVVLRKQGWYNLSGVEEC